MPLVTVVRNAVVANEEEEEEEGWVGFALLVHV